jgi:ABC-type uncharacterized transport system substrate-binding protein
VPQAQRIAVLVSPANVTNAERTLRDVEAAARTIGLQLQVLKANTAREIEEGFAWSERERPDALFVGAAAFLNIRRVQLVQLAAFHRLPATYGQREAAEVGGLMTYGPSILEGYRQWGIHAGRVLKGAKPVDLPVVQSTKVGVLMNTTPDEPESQARITALAQGLQEAGWSVGRNLRIDTRWSSGNRARLRKEAADLVALGPDVIVAGVGPTTLALQQVSHTVPIVMAKLSIRLAPASSRAWRGRGPTPPASPNSNLAWPPSG